MDEAMKLYEPIQAAYQANNAWSAEQAEKAMKYQEEMSNTAHQREVKDLKAAGLNPVLSAGGSGATTGSGMAAQRSDSNVDAIYGLASKALQASIDQSKAMQNTAKYVSGATGSSNSDGEKETSLSNIIADMLYRKYGIKQDHSLPYVESVLNPAEDWVKENVKGKSLKEILTTPIMTQEQIENTGKKIVENINENGRQLQQKLSGDKMKGSYYRTGDGFSGRSGKLGEVEFSEKTGTKKVRKK